MIHVPCPGCHKKLGIADKFAGRLVLCPACKTRVRVPTPERPAVEQLEEVEELEEIEDVLPAGPPKTGIKSAAGQTGTRRPPEDEDRPRRRPPDEGDYDEEEDRPRRRRRRIPKPRRRKLKYEQGGGIFSEGIFGMEVFTVVMLGVALLSLPLLALSFVPGVGAIFALLAMALGALMSMAGGIWLLIVAFAEDSTTGLLCLFIPFYMFYFILTEFETCKRPFFVYALGLILVFGASCAAGPGPGYHSFGRPGRFGALSGPQPAYAAGAPRPVAPA
jgi:hypothetical protein